MNSMATAIGKVYGNSGEDVTYDDSGHLVAPVCDIADIACHTAVPVLREHQEQVGEVRYLRRTKHGIFAVAELDSTWFIDEHDLFWSMGSIDTRHRSAGATARVSERIIDEISLTANPRAIGIPPVRCYDRSLPEAQWLGGVNLGDRDLIQRALAHQRSGMPLHVIDTDRPVLTSTGATPTPTRTVTPAPSPTFRSTRPLRSGPIGRIIAFEGRPIR